VEVKEIVTERGLLPELPSQGRIRMMALHLNNEEKEMPRHFRKRLQRRQLQNLEEKMLAIAMPKPRNSIFAMVYNYNLDIQGLFSV
jgi:hypothetical protein